MLNFEFGLKNCLVDLWLMRLCTGDNVTQIWLKSPVVYVMHQVINSVSHHRLVTTNLMKIVFSQVCFE